MFRNWEVAGASHGDWKLITDYGPLRKRDIGTYPGGYPGEPQTCTLPSLSRVPQHMVQNAVYDHTFSWVAYGIAPPSAPVITTATPAGGAITRDSLGLAAGRHPPLPARGPAAREQRLQHRRRASAPSTAARCR